MLMSFTLFLRSHLLTFLCLCLFAFIDVARAQTPSTPLTGVLIVSVAVPALDADGVV